jgi:hypothetical protein
MAVPENSGSFTFIVCPFNKLTEKSKRESINKLLFMTLS